MLVSKFYYSILILNCDPICAPVKMNYFSFFLFFVFLQIIFFSNQSTDTKIYKNPQMRIR